MDEHCYFAKQPPKLELRDGHISLMPAGSHCEVVFTPHTLRKFVASAQKLLDEFDAKNTVAVFGRH